MRIPLCCEQIFFYYKHFMPFVLNIVKTAILWDLCIDFQLLINLTELTLNYCFEFHFIDFFYIYDIINCKSTTVSV